MVGGAEVYWGLGEYGGVEVHPYEYKRELHAFNTEIPQFLEPLPTTRDSIPGSYCALALEFHMGAGPVRVSPASVN